MADTLLCIYLHNVFQQGESAMFPAGRCPAREAGAVVVFTRVLYHLHVVYQTTAIQKTISL